MTDDRTRPRPLSRLLRLHELELTAARKRARAEATERRLAREAAAAGRRAHALALRRSGATYAEIGQVLGICPARAQQICRKAERLANTPRWYDQLPMRAQNFLINAGLAELPEPEAARAIARLSRRELMATPNFGKTALAAIEVWLRGLGFEPRDGSDPIPGPCIGEENEQSTNCTYGGFARNATG